MPSYYGPRPDSWGGSQTIVNAPSGVNSAINPPVDYCFNQGSIVTYLQSNGISDQKDIDRLLQERFFIKTEPDGTTWFCGGVGDKYRSATLKIINGKYAGGKVLIVRGEPRQDTNGNIATFDIPTKITATDSTGNPVPWTDVRSSIDPNFSVRDNLLNIGSSSNITYIVIGAFVLLMLMAYYFFKK